MTGPDHTPHPDGSARSWRIAIPGSAPFACREDQSVLDAMRQAGLNPLAVGCRGGGCGVCRVRVETGAYHARPMSTSCVPPAEAAHGLALACRIMPREDLGLRAAPMERCCKPRAQAA